MVIKNHIAYRFLTDTTLHMEMCGETHPGDWKKLANKKGEDIEKFMTPELEGFFHLTSPERSKTFYVTESVIKNLDALKVNKEGLHFNWTVFKHIKDQKITLIFPDNKLLRVFIHPNKNGDKTIELFWLTFKKKKEAGENIDGTMFWVMNYLVPATGAMCEHFDHPDSLEIEEFMYKTMCFFFLSENTEEIIPAGKVHGTRKTGKISNDFKFPIVMVTSKWNITSIRTEGFGVSGHLRLQPCGPGRSETEMIFIEPFMKNGYKRTAGKINHI